MAIFGWICLLLISLYILFTAVVSIYFSMGFSGKVHWIQWIFLIFSITITGTIIRFAPFTIALK